MNVSQNLTKPFECLMSRFLVSFYRACGKHLNYFVVDEKEETDDRFSVNNGSHTHLWQFLKELLGKPAAHGSAIRWVDRSKGEKSCA